jgi:ParB family transcriptional regulator, chromosome partitioning protein
MHRPPSSQVLCSRLGNFFILPVENVLHFMALAMAETLACGTATAEAVALTTNATLNDWRPDDAFFDLLKGKDVVSALLADIASPAVADGNRNETVKVQKDINKDFVNGSNGRKHKMDWLPPYFRFPPTTDTQRGGIAVVDKWLSVAELITSAM